MFLLTLGIAISLPTYHTSHADTYGTDVPKANLEILKGVDRVQATAMDGGGYFIGVKASPPECPVGYPVTFLGEPMLTPTRPTSYCSGASYAAFIEALGELVKDRQAEISEDQVEALRMEEPDGGRREDMVKFWGWWNADGPGSLYALTLYTQMGTRVAPESAIPGDFCNINWVSGPGHSVVFLGWEITEGGEQGMRFWSSQKSTNGFGDLVVPLRTISGYVFTRLTRPDAVINLDPTRIMHREKVEYDIPVICAHKNKALLKK